MFKPVLLLVLIALVGLGEAMSLAEVDDVGTDAAAISKNVNELKYLFFSSPDDHTEMEFNNRASLVSANIDPSKPVVIIIDGFLSNSTSPMTTLLKQTFTAHGGRNVIVLNWSRLSGSEARVGNALLMAGAYLTVLGNVGPVGHRLAQFLEVLEETKGVPLSEVTLVGGSLGAHIAGAAGSYIRNKYGAPRIGRIIGLDPAGPFFSMQVDRDKRLHRGDALIVEVYHSNRGTLGDSEHDTGDINVYLNGGNNQPGCAEADRANTGICSHNYAFKAFNLAFNGNVKACPCSGDSACTCNTCSYSCSNPLTLGPNSLAGASGRYHATLGEI